MKEAEYYDKLPEGVVSCTLCPHNCHIARGKRGICKSRVNVDGVLCSEVYGHPCAVAIDPIEKKPFRMFYPGSSCLSIACTGCNLRCLNCQNFEISQVEPVKAERYDLSPADIVEMAQREGQKIIAYTYTEPLTYLEYVRDTARLAHERGLKNVLVSAGYVNVKALNDLLPWLDAANIDLKSFSDDIYRRVSGGSLRPVLDTILRMKDAGVWLEITHLLIPTVNDDAGMFRQMCGWLTAHHLASAPLHISRFFPLYKMSHLYATPLSTMQRAERIAREEGIEHVFLGNV